MLKTFVLQAAQKGLEARRARIEQRSVLKTYVSMRESKRNAAYESFSAAYYSQRLRRRYDLTSLYDFAIPDAAMPR
jgi:hypothetical protein